MAAPYTLDGFSSLDQPTNDISINFFSTAT